MDMAVEIVTKEQEYQPPETPKLQKEIPCLSAAGSLACCNCLQNLAGIAPLSGIPPCLDPRNS